MAETARGGDARGSVAESRSAGTTPGSDAATARVDVLGPLRIEAGGRPADAGGPRQRAVLARLVAAGGHVVPTDRFIDDLWQGEPPPKALAALQVYVSNLRRALEPGRAPRTPATVVVSLAPGYALRLPDEQVDAWRFEALLRRGSELAGTDPRRADRLLRAALDAWAGPAYAEFADERWAAPEVARLEELRLACVEASARVALRLGRAALVVPELDRHVQNHPLREEAVHVLATALYRTGRQADALAALRQARDRLADELGVDPGPALRALEADVLAHAEHLSAGAPPEPPGAAPYAEGRAGLGTAPDAAAGGPGDGPGTQGHAGLDAAPEAAARDRGDGPGTEGRTGFGAAPDAAVPGWRDAPDTESRTRLGAASAAGADDDPATVGDGAGTIGREAGSAAATGVAGHQAAEAGSRAADGGHQAAGAEHRMAEAGHQAAEAGFRAAGGGHQAAGAGHQAAGIGFRAAGSGPVRFAAVGRETELAELGAAAEAVLRDGLRIVWVGGEAGAGKTTLVRAFSATVAARDWRVAWGRCPEVDGAPPAWAWNEVLAGWDARAGSAGWDARAGSTGPAPAPGAARPGGAADQFQLAQAVSERLGAGGPLLVVLDDAHRADGETLQVLRHVAVALAGRAVLVVATFRTGEDHPQLGAARAALAGPRSTELLVGGLGADAAARVLAEHLGAPVEAGVAAVVHARTGGNPLFLAETARLISAEGAGSAVRAIPSGIGHVLRRRLARLPATAQTILRHAAVLGRDVDIDVLAEAFADDEDAVFDGLEAGVLAGLLEEPAPGRVRFGHALLRDVLYDDMPQLRRRRLHERVLTVLERTTPGDVAALGHHALAAATPATAERAARHGSAAARQAAAHFAHREAAQLYAASLEALALRRPGSGSDGGDTRSLRLDLLCGLTSARANSGDAIGARASRWDAVHAAAAMAGLTAPVPTAAAVGHPAADGTATTAGRTPPDSTAMTAGLITPGSATTAGRDGPHPIAATAGRTPLDGTATTAGLITPGSATTAGRDGPDLIAATAGRAPLDSAAATAGRAGPDSTAAVLPPGAITAPPGAQDERYLRALAAVPDVEPLARALTAFDAPVAWSIRVARIIDQPLVDLLERALARPDLPAGWRARMLVALVYELEGDDVQRCADASAEALRIARAEGDAGLLCQALNARYFAVLNPQRRHELPAVGAELLAVAERAGLLGFQAQAHHVLYQAALERSDLRLAQEHLDRALERSTAGQLGVTLSVMAILGAIRALFAGDHATAERIYTELGERIEAAGQPNAALVGIIGVFFVRLTQGLGHTCLPVLEPLRSLATAESEAGEFIARALVDAGRLDEARAAWRPQAPVREDYYWLALMGLRGENAAALGDAAVAAECYERLLPWAGQFVGLASGTVAGPPVDLVLGRLATALGRPAGAHFAAARELAVRTGARPWAEQPQPGRD